PVQIEQLRMLLTEYQFCVKKGDLRLIQGRWYVTHTGLLGLSVRRRCQGVHSEPLPLFCDAASSRWAFKAIVYKSRGCKGFVGHGDADPSNVSSLVRGAEMRIAETRAVDRALREAFGVGICSIEEIGATPEPSRVSAESKKMPPHPANGNGSSRTIRDRLCEVIRAHELDPSLVRSFAIEFCAVKTLKEATREQVENFVIHLSDWAEKDRNALLCQLNSYLGQKEGAA
ncbi:MAG TPA: hypothetical protein VE866_15985, partial [Candidatus Binatia bacterium]|nr:hypothetical protein [Candidatus Binatia bacterium]